ncbi:DUF86 domain-containing protein [Microbacterium sp.]|uniref:HepT-like ribonuclease domain-containing protein n=1 Tax=Microbacterium sp. TaxID=51671 RepID=UPI003C730689
MSRTIDELVREALSHLEAVHRHLARGSVEDETVADAVSLRIAAMIETLHRGAPDLTDGFFGDEWAVIWGMRNRIAHGYAWVDIETVRATVEEDLPGVEAKLRALSGMSADAEADPEV